jgi:hypothetical protein
VLTTNNHELWVSDGNSTVKVFDLTKSSHPLITTISTNGVFRGDEMCYDPGKQLVMVANNSQADHNSKLNSNGPFATVISVKHHAIVTQIAFDGTKGAPKSTNGAEQCSFSKRGERFYITIPGIEDQSGPHAGHGVVAVINPEDLNNPNKSVERVLDIPDTKCDTPQGTAVGPDFQLLVGCNGSSSATNSVVIDQHPGSRISGNTFNARILAAVPGESGPDEVWYNPGDGQYFLAISGGPASATSQVLGVIDARGLKADTSVKTANKPNPPASSSHSVAADPVTNQVFVAIGGNNSSDVCGKAGGDNTLGCIAAYTAPQDDQCLAEGAPVREAKAGEDPVFMKGRCVDHDRHHDHEGEH